MEMKKERMSVFFIIVLLLVNFLSCVPKKLREVEGNEIKISQLQMPLLTRKDNILLTAQLDTTTVTQITSISLHLLAEKKLKDISEISVYRGQEKKFSKSTKVGTTTKINRTVVIPISQEEQGNYLWIVVKVIEKPDLLNKVYLKSVVFRNDNNEQYPTKGKLSNKGIRFGLTLLEKCDNDVDTYRIPGLTTTNKGTLIAVYDNRYNNSKDLQEDIDVGMSRSTDGGQTWEPMKVIMDMGEWGGKPQNLNGIGDPAVLVDKQTNTIWVAALWLHGGDPEDMAWWISQPCMTPEELTGQFMLVKSEDDGRTWSAPINITEQIKDSSWYLFFNGPGSGITKRDGKLVFAAQYKDSLQVPHSTIVYSDDRGNTWKVGTGAKSHTTEAQVVELSDQTLMLNMRDDRNRKNIDLSDDKNGRSVAITNDFGVSWTEHNTSRSALIEPNCMASIISVDHPKYGYLLFFSNPNSEKRRNHMTIKMSKDDGNTWDEGIEIYQRITYGYSCLTLVDENHLGILYEGRGDLYFQKIPIDDFFK